MHATVLNCSLKASPETSNTQLLSDHVIDELSHHAVTTSVHRLADLHVPPGVATRVGDDDEWPTVRTDILQSQILIVATPTWVGHPSSLAQRALERMDAMISETGEDGQPVAYNRVAGVVVTGNEDGAHHVISEICGGLVDIGFTIPGQAWTYWNRGPGPGDDFSNTTEGHDWSIKTGRAMARNLLAVAKALAARPIGGSHAQKE
jgi:multimeric flavodoxin WrbA